MYSTPSIDPLKNPQATLTQVNSLESKAFLEAARDGQLKIIQNYIQKNKTNPAAINATDVHGNTALVLAAIEGRLPVVQALLAVEGIDINRANEFGDTALIWASVKGHFEIVKSLLTIPGIEIDKANKNQDTPLMQAASGNHARIVQILIEKGASIALKNNNQVTALERTLDETTLQAFQVNELFQAASFGNINLAEQIIKQVPVNSTNSAGDSALILAARNGHLDIVLSLISAGADIQIKNKGQTALDEARLKGHTAIVEALQKVEFFNAIKRSDLSFVGNYLKANPLAIQWVDSKGNTPLMVAAQNRKMATFLQKESLFQAAETGNLTALEQRLAQVSGNSTNQQGDTPLIIAARHGHLHIIQALLQRKVAIEPKNNAQNTAADEARLHGHTEILKRLQNAEFFQAIIRGDLAFVENYLKDNPESIHEEDSFGNTSLILATMHGHELVFKVLLAKGGSIDHANRAGDTALLWAASKGQLGIVQALLDKGADFYHQNTDRSSALDNALRNRHPAVIQALQKIQSEDLLKAVTAGNLARVQQFVAEGKRHLKIVNENGETPLLLAVRAGKLDIVHSLVTVDCYVNETNNAGENALNCAVLMGNLDMVKALLTAPGIQIDVTSKESGFTPLMNAAYTGNIEIVEALLNKGANVKIKDAHQDTAEQIAKKSNHEAIAARIRKADKEWEDFAAISVFLKKQVADKVGTLSLSYPRERDGEINPTLKIFGTKQNKMENDRWEIFVLLKNEAGEVGMRSGVKSETWDYDNLNVTGQFDFSLFPNPLTQEIKDRLQQYRHGHPTLALNFTKLDQGIYETLPVFSGGWLLRNDSGPQKRIQVYWSSGRYSANRSFSFEQEHLLELCTACHLMREYGKDIVVEFYPYSSTSLTNFITKNARGGKLYDLNNLTQEVRQMMTEGPSQQGCVVS